MSQEDAERNKALDALPKLLFQRRCQAGLTRRELAKRARLPDATIRSLEEGRMVPTRETCLRLYAVEALRLKWAELEPIAGRPPHIEP